jgi:hypothetical protein
MIRLIADGTRKLRPPPDASVVEVVVVFTLELIIADTFAVLGTTFPWLFVADVPIPPVALLTHGVIAYEEAIPKEGVAAGITVITLLTEGDATTLLAIIDGYELIIAVLLPASAQLTTKLRNTTILVIQAIFKAYSKVIKRLTSQVPVFTSRHSVMK